jgi:hypothetical protein
VKHFGGEIIYISENSKTYINPLDLTPNPDPTDKEYAPIKAKFEFLQSFFSVILDNRILEPMERTVIDVVMRKTYQDYPDEPTLKEFYAVLEEYEKTNTGGASGMAAYLKESLHLYVFGSLNYFANR